MNKLPVFRTAGRAIGFTLWNSFTIFRLAWLPIALLLAAEIGLSAYILQLEGETLRTLPNPLTVGTILENVLAFYVVFLVLQTIAFAAVAVSIHRVILFGDHRPGQYFNFAFGKTEFLYIIMGLLTALIVLTVLAAIFTPFVLIVSGGDPIGMFRKFADDPTTLTQMMQHGKQSGWMGAFWAVYFVAYVSIIYVSLRLTVWPPSVVATNRLSPSDAWQLTRGNVWRFIGAFILTFGWIYLIIIVPATVGAYWYYTNKMVPPQDVPAITAPATPDAAQPSHEAPPPVVPEGPSATSGAAPATSSTEPSMSAQHEPEAASPSAPRAAPEAPTPNVIVMNVEKPDPEMVRRRLDETFGAFAPVMWVVFLLMYIYFPALAVALMSFSYKALKGYEPHEPIADA